MKELLDYYKGIPCVLLKAVSDDANERLRAYYDTMNKYGLSVTDSMVAYGDYSEVVEEQVRYLLDENPGLEAIAFANDSMAKTGYHSFLYYICVVFCEYTIGVYFM